MDETPARKDYTPSTWEQRKVKWMEIHDLATDAALNCARSRTWKGSGAATDMAHSALAQLDKIEKMLGNDTPDKVYELRYKEAPKDD